MTFDLAAVLLIVAACSIGGGAAWIVRGTRADRGVAPQAADAAPPFAGWPELVSRIGVVEAESRSLRAAFAGFTEECEAILESVDRKRKQTTSAAARMMAAQGEQGGAIDGVSDATPQGAPLDRVAEQRLVRARLRGEVR